MEAATAAAPPRSLVQRMAALDRANEIRSYRADLKVRIKAGEQPVRAVLLKPVDELASMKVFDVLLAIPSVGRVKANKILSRSRCSPSKTIGGLSERQRGELVALLPASALRSRLRAVV